MGLMDKVSRPAAASLSADREPVLAGVQEFLGQQVGLGPPAHDLLYRVSGRRQVTSGLSDLV